MKSYEKNWQIRPNSEEARVLESVTERLRIEWGRTKGFYREPGPSDVLRFLVYYYRDKETPKESAGNETNRPV